MTLTDKQRATELSIMKYLNRRRDYSTHYFDCGELGYLRIYWLRHGWKKEWFDLEPTPLLEEEINDSHR